MSPRAAWRLETLGFSDVYEYAAGKADWGAYGLPLEGKATRSARLKDIARADVPTCGLDETVGAARERAGDWGTCIVVTDGRIVLGRMFQSDLEGDPGARVGDVMRAGTSTFRPNTAASEMREYMDRRKHDSSLVTTPDGRLVGLVLLADVVAADEREAATSVR
jgi:CBS-domain-containing membrane protein